LPRGTKSLPQSVIEGFAFTYFELAAELGIVQAQHREVCLAIIAIG